MKYLKVIVILVVLGTIGGAAYLGFKTQEPKCPDDYRDPEDAVAAFDDWLQDFYKAHPDASLAEVRHARIQHYLNNRCKAALERIAEYESGQVDKSTQDSLQEAIQQSLK